MPRGLTERMKSNIAMVLEILRKYQPIHIRGIAKIMSQVQGKHVDAKTINRIVDNYLEGFVDVEKTDRYGNTLKFVSLKSEKQSATLQDVLKLLEIKKSIKQ